NDESGGAADDSLGSVVVFFFRLVLLLLCTHFCGVEVRIFAESKYAFLRIRKHFLNFGSSRSLAIKYSAYFSASQIRLFQYIPSFHVSLYMMTLSSKLLRFL